MIHIVHLIERRRDGRPLPAFVLPLLALSALALAGGIALLLT